MSKQTKNMNGITHLILNAHNIMFVPNDKSFERKLNACSNFQCLFKKNLTSMNLCKHFRYVICVIAGSHRYFF